jgi:hypothetical protein
LPISKGCISNFRSGKTHPFQTFSNVRHCGPSGEGKEQSECVRRKEKGLRKFEMNPQARKSFMEKKKEIASALLYQ